MYRIIAHQYPNNEIRITKSHLPPVKRDRASDRGGEIDCELLAPIDHEVWQSFLENSPPLSLGPNSKPERSHAGYGSLPPRPRRFGLNAKRQLIRAGAAMEKSVAIDECLFLTGTLPGSTESAFRAIAEWSGYLVNNLKAWIAKYQNEKLDFYCWEYQKRGALHLHYCVHIASPTDRDYILRNFHGWWVETLHRIGEKSVCDLFRKNSEKTWANDPARVRAVAEVCRKSPGRYLAKYLSKSAAPKRGASRAFSPSSWWGTSRPLKALVESMTSVVEVIQGGFHAVCRKWEDVKALWSTTEGVTHEYQHKFGMGQTLLSYPVNQEETAALWMELKTVSTIQRGLSKSDMRNPLPRLKTLRNMVLDTLSRSLSTLSDSFQGLRTYLTRTLSLIQKITPSRSTEPLKNLLCLAAVSSDMRSVCAFSPVDTREWRILIQEWLDCLESSIEFVCENGWTMEENNTNGNASSNAIEVK
jgi:hypothetical protein